MSDTPGGGWLYNIQHSIPRYVKIVLVLASFGVLGWLLATGRGFELGFFKLPPFETAQERSCKAMMQTAESNEKAVKSRIEALDAQNFSIRQRISELQGACLSEVLKRPDTRQTGCAINGQSISDLEPQQRNIRPFYAGGSVYYLQVINDLLRDRESINQNISVFQEEQKQRHEEWLRISERCSGFTLPR